MKTTDLIPIILYQLVDGDKYGYEIIKQIEDCSNGGIVIKQPTLYSVLKKLEQGRFISSYWQDSEIGGKRHYYKLSDNGKSQLDTYPGLKVLINDILESDGVVIPALNKMQTTDNDKDIVLKQDTVSNIEDISTINLEESEIIKPTPIDITINTQHTEDISTLDTQDVEDLDINQDISTEEENSKNLLINDLDNIKDVIKNDIKNVDLPTYNSLTENKEEITVNPVEIEQPNTNNMLEENISSPINIFDAIEYDEIDSDDKPLIKTENTSLENDNALGVVDELSPIDIDSDVVVSNAPVNKLYGKLTPNLDLSTTEDNKVINEEIYSAPQIEKIKFLNYINFDTDKNTIKRRKAITKHIQKMLLTCFTLLCFLVINFVVCNKYGFGKIYYIVNIISVFVLVLYPILLLRNVPKIKLKYCTKPFKYSPLRDLFVKLSITLSIIIIIFAYNLSIATQVSEIFALSNFANFFAPIILITTLIMDFMYSAILYKKY